MTDRPAATPIEDYLDELLRRTHADPRTTRRVLDEAEDHLTAAADDLQTAGLGRVEAEREAVRRLGPPGDLASGSRRRAMGALVQETLFRAALLVGCGLVAVGLSGGVVAIMNALLGDDFAGGATVLGTGGSPVVETAQDAVVLRVLAGVAGLLVLSGYALTSRYHRSSNLLPPGLIDALGGAAFAAAAIALTGASIDQGAISTVGHGVGFFLSGALVSLAGAIFFCRRAARALLPTHTQATNTH